MTKLFVSRICKEFPQLDNQKKTAQLKNLYKERHIKGQETYEK